MSPTPHQDPPSALLPPLSIWTPFRSPPGIVEACKTASHTSSTFSHEEWIFWCCRSTGLWPFELDQLGSIDPHFAYTAVCDHRLSPSSTLTRGCGGCAILWRKSIPAVPVSLLESDRICSIQVPFEGCQLPLTIVGVYMPSSEYPQETYNEYFNGINQALSALPLSSPLLLVGDLNCHIGKLGGPRSSSDPNQRGVQ